jgi:hypothetical protein
MEGEAMVEIIAAILALIDVIAEGVIKLALFFWALDYLLGDRKKGNK